VKHPILLTLITPLFGLGLGALAAGCSHAPTAQPYDSVVVDRSDPQKTVVEFNGACAQGVSEGHLNVQGKKDYKVTQDGKTYYFSNAEARDRFLKDYPNSAQRASANWDARQRQS
jgi:YHS domain-containing protein